MAGGTHVRKVLVMSAAMSVMAADQRQKQQPMNVLMISVDDLRPSGAAYNVPEIKLPNLDKLAARSTVFTQAYVQAATCGVSRSSLLTSRRPDSNYVLSNGECPFSTAPSHKNWQSLPEYFRASGYTTAGFGKVFHPNVCDGAAAGERAAAWTLPYYHAPCISLGSIYNGSCYESYPGPLPQGKGGKVTSIYSNTSVDATDDTMPDGMIAASAVNTMKKLAAKKDSPFFMAVGFHKPHLPHIAPSKYFDLYPLETVSLPSDASRHAPQNAPSIAWNSCSEFQSYKDVKNFTKAEGFSESHPLDDDTTRRQRQAYFAAASYTDAQIGRLLDQLELLGLAESTVVAMWGDHGWHLGENNEWAKHTAMTWANRAPLMFAKPGHQGQSEPSFAEFVDIYPTLADLAGISVPEPCADVNMSQTSPNCTEGRSLAAFVQGDDNAVGTVASFSQWPKGGSMGYNIFTTMTDGSQVRYTEWVGYKDHGPVWDQSVGAELYNRTADPDENINILSKVSPAEALRLSQMLHGGWRNISVTSL